MFVHGTRQIFKMYFVILIFFINMLQIIIMNTSIVMQIYAA